MDSLKIDATETTPAVSLNRETGAMEITGVSNEEDALGFYYPVIQWIDTYMTQPCPETNMQIRLKFFNTASSKALFEIFKRLNRLKKQGKHVVVNWYYTKDDDTFREDIEYFNDLTSLDIQAVAE